MQRIIGSPMIWILALLGSSLFNFLSGRGKTRRKANLLVWQIVALIALFSGYALAQTNPNEEQGLRPYDSLHGGDLDSVSLTNGGLAFHIPLVSFPQRGNLDLSFMVRFSSKQWQIIPAKFDSQGH